MNHYYKREYGKGTGQKISQCGMKVYWSCKEHTITLDETKIDCPICIKYVEFLKAKYKTP